MARVFKFINNNPLRSMNIHTKLNGNLSSGCADNLLGSEVLDTQMDRQMYDFSLNPHVLKLRAIMKILHMVDSSLSHKNL